MENNSSDLHYSLRLTIYKDEKLFGPGVERLLSGIKESGSINSACHAMDMSYTKGWRILNSAERQLGIPLVERKTGGSGGGSSTLTAEGEYWLSAYIAIRTELEESADRLFEKYFLLHKSSQ